MGGPAASASRGILQRARRQTAAAAVQGAHAAQRVFALLSVCASKWCSAIVRATASRRLRIQPSTGSRECGMAGHGADGHLAARGMHGAQPSAPPSPAPGCIAMPRRLPQQASTPPPYLLTRARRSPESAVSSPRPHAFLTSPESAVRPIRQGGSSTTPRRPRHHSPAIAPPSRAPPICTMAACSPCAPVLPQRPPDVPLAAALCRQRSACRRRRSRRRSRHRRRSMARYPRYPRRRAPAACT